MHDNLPETKLVRVTNLNNIWIPCARKSHCEGAERLKQSPAEGHFFCRRWSRESAEVGFFAMIFSMDKDGTMMGSTFFSGLHLYTKNNGFNVLPLSYFFYRINIDFKWLKCYI